MTTTKESIMAKHPTRPDARDDGDDSTNTRPDNTQTDGTPADQSHADSPAQKAEDQEDRGGVNPDAPGPHSDITDPTDLRDDAGGPAEGRKDGAVIPETSVDAGSLAAQRQVDELDSAIRAISKAVGGIDAGAIADPDRDPGMEGTLAGRLRSLTVTASAIARRLEADRAEA